MLVDVFSAKSKSQELASLDRKKKKHAILAMGIDRTGLAAIFASLPRGAGRTGSHAVCGLRRLPRGFEDTESEEVWDGDFFEE